MEYAIAQTTRPGNGASTPLYQQIYLMIRHQILSGEYPNRTMLPSEHETAKLFGVSRITAKRALNEVAAAGLCVRRRGQGSRVTYTQSGAPLKSDIQGLMDHLADAGLEMEGHVLEFEYIEADGRIAEIMNINKKAEVQRSVRTRRIEGKPLSYLTTYVPAELGRLYERDQLTNQAPLTLLENAGVPIAGAEQTITATLAEAVTAEALEVKQGAPLLRIRRVVFDHRDRVVEFIVGLYRPDQYQYQMSLSRVADGDKRSWLASE
ncbi:MAG: GntR family transcriptional regulator [Rhodospirillaceae bacterium]|nr:GntR family transcriptional regulator [Rhodospirillaceae bacterium]MBT5298179.1 GntR family transcriptional regulator [Rhodospirillaceae bacterium]MBT6086058.1 GntR family transcriptional regulator [Rhodospirillaceae bacterium]MBT7247780.1 GntR family transcriptional regulator [Rhodospirillaceae bacterium]MBT7509272.1 GntR family transcriptional regulator [Rhodospirillaceae bacterium]